MLVFYPSFKKQFGLTAPCSYPSISSLHDGNMNLYSYNSEDYVKGKRICNLKNSKNWLNFDVQNESQKVPRYKILYKCYSIPIKTKEKIPLTTATKILKYLGMNLRIMLNYSPTQQNLSVTPSKKIMRNLDEENYKPWKQKWDTFHIPIQKDLVSSK